MKTWKAAALSALVIVFAGCGGAGASSNGTPTSPPVTTPSGGGTPPTTNPNIVNLGDQSFTPATLTVNAGTTVTWQWPTCDSTGSNYGGYAGCVTHSITFDDGSNIASGTQSSGSFTRTFAAVGTFKYHCAVHGASVMSGSIIVK